MSRTALIALGAVLAFTAWSAGMVAWGQHIEGQAAALRESRDNEKHAQDLLEANGRVRLAFALLNQDQADVGQKFEKERTDAQAENDRFVAGLWSGATRVSIPVVAQTCAAGPAAVAALAGSPQETRAELVPATAADLAAIAHDGDTGIRTANECIERYELARARLDALNRPQTTTAREP